MPLAADIRECPVSWGLALTWTLIFAAMLAVQHALAVPAPELGLGDPLGISPIVGHRFGDLTWFEVRRGEVWRLVTATFIHFGLIHIVMNVTALLKLGQLIEPWYRGGPFLAVCLLIGGLGNLIGGLLRVGVSAVRLRLAGTFPARVLPSWFDAGGPAGVEAAYQIPSGGGSTILLGLLGLGAVVGWRSRTRIGAFLRDQMVTALVMTAILGFVLVNLLDNYGHAGGAIVGAALGFGHRPLLRVAERSRAFRLGCWAFSVAVIALSLGAALRDDRAEAHLRAEADAALTRFQLDDAVLGDLDRLAIQYVMLVAQLVDAGAWGDRGGLKVVAVVPLLERLSEAAATGPGQITGPTDLPEMRTTFAEPLTRLAAQPLDSWGPGPSLALAEVVERGRQALGDAPQYRDVYAFTVAWRLARSAVALDRDQARRQQVRLNRDEL